MSEIKWTAEQLTAIRAIEGNVLVAASAGSGKTAVLAQRCVYLLTEAAKPSNIEELLVLTYTEAAAGEMRRRIGQELYRYSREHPGKKDLLRQLAILDKANISTVHAFCNAVLREFFYLAGVDPLFTILDAEEAELLKLQAARELYEECYGQVGEPQAAAAEFGRFVQSYGAGSSDRELVYLLVRLHNFLETLRDHEESIVSWRKDLETAAEGQAANLAVVKQQKQFLQRQLQRQVSRLEHARQIIDYYPHLELYRQYMDGDLLPVFRDMRKALAEDDFSGALEKLDMIGALPRTPNRPKGLSDEEIAPVKNNFDEVRESFRKTKRRFQSRPMEVNRQVVVTAPMVNQLIRLQGEFARRYEDMKRRQNVLDFADLEHKALKLLRGSTGGGASDGETSEVIGQLRGRFKYILVDEYQDISPIQEEIIRYISRGESGGGDDQASKAGGGNLFMVGDVKQSIYGFRQADPQIFLDKYHHFSVVKSEAEAKAAGGPANKRIDLNRNFRSRREIIDGVNYIFSRCMVRELAGLEYDSDARLSYGADYYDAACSAAKSQEAYFFSRPVEVHLIDKNMADDSEPGQEEEHREDDDTNSEAEQANLANGDDRQELDAARREALIVGRRIRELVEQGGNCGSQRNRAGRKADENTVIDSTSGQTRPIQYRDIAILLRSTKGRAEIWVEVLSQMGIPVHAQLSRGYFIATEIQDMMSLLRLLDNFQQDIPLASVLRSPLAGFNESQLTKIRLDAPQRYFYQSVVRYAKEGKDEPLRTRLRGFLEQIDRWRSGARGGNLAELIGQIYRQTHLPAYVSGMSNGRQRYRNLLSLFDHARQFDTFARQGLGRFLRFIEKLCEEEGDFGPAPVLTEADNVVRIMSIHKSKGLEFPVVILADMARKFNRTSQRQSIIYDRPGDCSVGVKVVDEQTRDSWPTMAHNLVADKIARRELAEEMRLLYVGLTRARERLILAGSVDLEKCRRQWQVWQYQQETALPEFILSSADTPMDWLGPALAGHPAMREFIAGGATADKPTAGQGKENYFVVKIHTTSDYSQVSRGSAGRDRTPDEIWLGGNGTEQKVLSGEAQKVMERINYRYPHRRLSELSSRYSVSELKRMSGPTKQKSEPGQDPDFSAERILWDTVEKEKTESNKGPESEALIPGTFKKRPRFLREAPTKATAVEKGIWTHLFLQHLELAGPMSEAYLTKQIQQLTARNILTPEQANNIDLAAVKSFFAGPLGQELMEHRDKVQREWPFTRAIPLSQLSGIIDNVDEIDRDEIILVRGIIDCLFETEKGVVIVDYKTDAVSVAEVNSRADAYRVQMRFYKQAVEEILGREVVGVYLYFLGPTKAVKVV